MVEQALTRVATVAARASMVCGGMSVGAACSKSPQIFIPLTLCTTLCGVEGIIKGAVQDGLDGHRAS